MTRWLGALAALAIGSCGLHVAGTGLPPAATIDGGVDAAGPPDATVLTAKSALSFSRSAKQYVNVPHVPIPQDFTLEAWVKPASAGAEMMIVAEDRSPLESDNQFRLALTAAGVPYFVMTDEASSAHGLAADAETGPYALSSAAPLPIGRWTHLAVSKAGTAARLLVDGAVVATVTLTDGVFPRDDNFDFRFAARMGSGGPADYFDGDIDEVRLFSVGRSTADIASDLRIELAAGAPARASLVGYWRFDEALGATAHDDLDAHDGTLVNQVSWVDSQAF